MPLTWTHLDIHGPNILTRDGHLAGLLDWGDAAVGDPAVGDPASTLPESASKRVEAEAVAYAALLGGVDEGDHAASGWAALVELGVIDPTLPRP